MKRPLALLAAFALLASVPVAFAAGGVKTELGELVTRIKAKLAVGQATEAGLADELKEFDALIAAHSAEKTDDVAQAVFMEATLYAQILSNPERALELLNRLKTDFAQTEIGKQVPMMIESLEKQTGALKIQRSLAVGTVFPGFEEKDTAGKPLSLANYRGKVVMLDFWATWCGPCITELPTVVAAYKKNHAQGFEIIGISLDREGDGEKLAEFTKTHEMPWPQFYDGQYWSNKLSTKYGVTSIPATYLLDGEGRIIGKDLRGPALEEAVAKALAKK